MKHFKLRTDLTKNILGITLYRVELTIDCKWGKKGTLGGYIEKEYNLQDNAWVYDNARVYGNAWVSGNARVSGNACVYDNAQVSDNACVYDNARVYGNAWVSGNARVYDNAWVYDNARVYGNAWVSGNARVYDDAKIEKYGQCVVINNQKNTITLTPNLIIIGCKTWKTLEDFEKTYRAIGAENNYTADETEMTVELVRAVMKRMTPIKETVTISHNGANYEVDLEKVKQLGIIK